MKWYVELKFTYNTHKLIVQVYMCIYYRLLRTYTGAWENCSSMLISWSHGFQQKTSINSYHRTSNYIGALAQRVGQMVSRAEKNFDA